jgi:anti-anti-sigma factor
MATPHTFNAPNPHVEESSVGDVDLFVLSGEFDAYSTPWLEEQLMAAIERGEYELVLDMCAVTFVDVSTLNVVIRAMKHVYRHNGHLVVACGQRPVLRAIELAGLQYAVRVLETRDEAIAAVRERVRD